MNATICPDCGRRFGGSRAMQIAHPRRLDRCLEPPEMRQRGLRFVSGVWRQKAVAPSERPLRLPGVVTSGGLSFEARRPLSERSAGVSA